MKKLLVILICFLSISALVGIRFFSSELFYDPLLLFFKSGYLTEERLPVLNQIKFLIHTSIRYWLNSALSIFILISLFRNREHFKIYLVIYAAVFLVLLLSFMLILNFYESDLNLFLFYVRRFLIQPLMLLILVPAFYYHKLQNKA